ncbi:SCP-like extracellular [Beutenbergia cavernae DSM 12333]|uniref:SCP-like extracellular n=1 Tax=Beutenbergia cavernae (strain ATCC BAA-8 / DSM 12333 / CCUG 43141 / JCM 11478 / NBRC 16432 / NCIMB 13614 / HKI 0122) TaxID=471853 RepID=C5C6G2_BEUC1|nr:CAP domain-containing protein [Beutenbergia cavernae]ACQ80368.1 SCP-like extracellular [Beutenbergia cavernae DSM 12333]
MHGTRRAGRRGGLSVVAALLALAFLVAPPATAPALASVGGDVAAHVNGSRAAAGLGGLAWEPGLAAVAQAWSEQMAAAGDLSHNPAVGDQIPAGWTTWGENVAWSTAPSAAGFHASLMESPGHRANILSPAFTSIGVGYAVAADGSGYLTQVFAAYPGAAVPPVVPEEPADPGAPPAEPTPEPAATLPPGWLGIGASGPDVERLQADLAALGHDVAVDGAYGPRTSAGVSAFQQQAGLAVDGVAGPATLEAVAAALARSATPDVSPSPDPTPSAPAASSAAPSDVVTASPTPDAQTSDAAEAATAAGGGPGAAAWTLPALAGLAAVAVAAVLWWRRRQAALAARQSPRT